MSSFFYINNKFIAHLNQFILINLKMELGFMWILSGIFIGRKKCNSFTISALLLFFEIISYRKEILAILEI